MFVPVAPSYIKTRWANISRNRLNIPSPLTAHSDTPRQKWTGVLPSPSPLATSPFDGGSSRGSLSRSVSSRGTGSRVPLGTVLMSRKSFMQDIQFTAILVEPGDSEIGTVGTGLSGLGVEATGKGIVFCQDSAIGLQVV